jgi:hypothetical protein
MPGSTRRSTTPRPVPAPAGGAHLGPRDAGVQRQLGERGAHRGEQVARRGSCPTITHVVVTPRRGRRPPGVCRLNRLCRSPTGARLLKTTPGSSALAYRHPGLRPVGPADSPGSRPRRGRAGTARDRGHQPGSHIWPAPSTGHLPRPRPTASCRNQHGRHHQLAASHVTPPRQRRGQTRCSPQRNVPPRHRANRAHSGTTVGDLGATTEMLTVTRRQCLHTIYIGSLLRLHSQAVCYNRGEIHMIALE